MLDRDSDWMCGASCISLLLRYKSLDYITIVAQMSRFVKREMRKLASRVGNYRGGRGDLTVA